MKKVEFHYESSPVFLFLPVIGFKFDKKEQIYSYNAYEMVFAWGFWMIVIVFR